MDYHANTYLPIIDPPTISQSWGGSEVEFQNVNNRNLI